MFKGVCNSDVASMVVFDVARVVEKGERSGVLVRTAWEMFNGEFSHSTIKSYGSRQKAATVNLRNPDMRYHWVLRPSGLYG